MVRETEMVVLADIQSARERLRDLGMFSPMVRLDGAPVGRTAMLKLENLQPVGSFKIRPIGSAVLARSPADLSRGIYTSSSGNSAIGVAWMARRLGIPATAVVPTDAPEEKLERLRRLGARIDMRPKPEWWQAIQNGSLPGQEGAYIDAVRDPAALAGDATLGMEILEGAPATQAILVPFGGGGLACGIASAVRALNSGAKVIACEIDSAAPLAAAMRAGRPVKIDYDAGFVSGVGYGEVLPEMWPLVRSLIDSVITVSLAEIAAAIRLMAESHHVIAEGAGAVAVAAALSGRCEQANVCAVVSGGNLPPKHLAAIFEGQVPA